MISISPNSHCNVTLMKEWCSKPLNCSNGADTDLHNDFTTLDLVPHILINNLLLVICLLFMPLDIIFLIMMAYHDNHVLKH